MNTKKPCALNERTAEGDSTQDFNPVLPIEVGVLQEAVLSVPERQPMVLIFVGIFAGPDIAGSNMAVEVGGINLTIMTQCPRVGPAGLIASTGNRPGLAPAGGAAGIVHIVARTVFVLGGSVDVYHPLRRLGIAGKNLGLGGDVHIGPFAFVFPADMVDDCADGELHAGSVGAIFTVTVHLGIAVEMSSLEGANALGCRASAIEVLGVELVVVGHDPRPGVVGLAISRSSGDDISGEVAIVVLAVHDVGQRNLLHVVDAGRGTGLLTGFGEGGQEHGGQDCDDRDDHQEFNQGKGLFHDGMKRLVGLAKSELKLVYNYR